MSAALYTFVPYDGSRESTVANPSAINIIDNPEKQTELYDRLEQDGIGARVWLSDKGVLVMGSKDDVRGVSNIVTAPSFMMETANTNAVPSMHRDFDRAADVLSFRQARRPSITGSHMVLAAA
jgi:hypothetical protein